GRRTGRSEDEDELELEEKHSVKADWKDVLALTIAAYQILLPLLGVIVAVLLLFLLFFKLWAH
ncbi:MAG: hypothetical protein ACM3XM_05575, partial [Mycobacterium leprae]